MMLGYEALLRLVSDGVIQGVDLKQVNSSSIDISLSSKLLLEEFDPEACIDLREVKGPPLVEKIMDDETGYLMSPGEFLLASSREIFNLPETLGAEFKLRSTMGRLGLDHSLAVLLCPGWTGSALTLEIKNNWRFNSILIRPGDLIGQVSFYSVEASPKFLYRERGRYNNDKETTRARSTDFYQARI